MLRKIVRDDQEAATKEVLVLWSILETLESRLTARDLTQATNEFSIVWINSASNDWVHVIQSNRRGRPT